MKTKSETRARYQQGFSLIELMVVLLILTLVTGVVFQQIDLVQKRYRTEDVKLDLTQESREFVDQMVRDLHTTGYPNTKMYSSGVLTAPVDNDSRNAVGVVQMTSTSIWVEGDVDNDGQVDSIQYQLQAIGGSCPCTIRRSQVVKVNGVAPMAQATSFSMEVSDVVNSAGLFTISGNSVLASGTVSNDTLYGAYKAAPIFQAFDSNGAAVALPVDITTNLAAVRSIRSVRITVNVLASPSGVDFETRLRPAVTMTVTAGINN